MNTDELINFIQGHSEMSPDVDTVEEVKEGCTQLADHLLLQFTKISAADYLTIGALIASAAFANEKMTAEVITPAGMNDEGSMQ